MRTSFHHQPEAQHPNFPLSVSWQADYPILWHLADMPGTPSNVCFRGESRHCSKMVSCPLMTQSGHRLDRNSAPQQSPAVPS